MKIKERLYEIIFEADTPAGKNFDVVLLFVILLSVLLVMLESVPAIAANYLQLLRTLEWIITAIFTLEYILRILIIKKPIRYIFSFYGIIDFLSVIPTYLSLFIVGSHSLVVISASANKGLSNIKINQVHKCRTNVASCHVAKSRKNKRLYFPCNYSGGYNWNYNVFGRRRNTWIY